MPHGLSLSNFRAVLFDVDGTLVDSMDMLIQGLGDAFEKYSGKRPPSNEIRSIIGQPLRVQLGLYLALPPSAEELQEMTEFTLSRFEANQHLERSFDGALSTLALCHRAGIKTALVTSKCSVELAAFMNRFPGAQHVDATVCASDVINPKPHPESALLACERLGVAPAQALMIGDSVFDIRCAKAAGVRSIAVTYGASDASVLSAIGPDALIQSPEELLRWAESELLETTCPERKI